MSLGSTPPWHALVTSCHNAETVVIVAPYMKADVLEQVLIAVEDSAIITCVSRWTPEAIRLGTTDLACRELTLTHNGNFLLHDRLHAKYYRFDNKVLIGSSNLTRPGMNVTGTGNLEILCLAPPEFDAAQFESQLLQEAYPVSDADFDQWNQITPIHQQDQKIPPRNNLHSPDSWKPTTRRPEYLWLAYQQRRVDIPSVEQQEIARQEVIALSVPEGLTEEKFNNWVRLSLMTSPFVKSVLAGLDEAIEAAWDRLSQQWSISKAEAERSRSTTESWLAYFGTNAPQNPPSHTEANSSGRARSPS